MIARLRPAEAARGATLLFLVLLAPPLRHALEASMTAQMLVQIPLLAAAGWLAAMALPARLSAAIGTCNEHGISGLVLGFVITGVLLLEGIATLLRLGGLYLVSPERLCNLYLLDDQQRLGRLLLLIGTALFLGVACKLVWGRFDALSNAAATPRPTQR